MANIEGISREDIKVEDTALSVSWLNAVKDAAFLQASMGNGNASAGFLTVDPAEDPKPGYMRCYSTVAIEPFSVFAIKPGVVPEYPDPNPDYPYVTVDQAFNIGAGAVLLTNGSAEVEAEDGFWAKIIDYNDPVQLRSEESLVSGSYYGPEGWFIGGGQHVLMCLGLCNDYDTEETTPFKTYWFVRPHGLMNVFGRLKSAVAPRDGTQVFSAEMEVYKVTTSGGGGVLETMPDPSGSATPLSFTVYNLHDKMAFEVDDYVTANEVFGMGLAININLQYDIDYPLVSFEYYDPGKTLEGYMRPHFSVRDGDLTQATQVGLSESTVIYEITTGDTDCDSYAKFTTFPVFTSDSESVPPEVVINRDTLEIITNVDDVDRIEDPLNPGLYQQKHTIHVLAAGVAGVCNVEGDFEKIVGYSSCDDVNQGFEPLVAPSALFRTRAVGITALRWQSIQYDPSDGGTITFDDTNIKEGDQIHVKNTTDSSVAITIAAGGANTIQDPLTGESAATISLKEPDISVVFQFSNGLWSIL